MQRRRWLGALPLAAGVLAAQGPEAGPWRGVAVTQGVALGDDRWRVLGPVLEGRRAQLSALRAFAIDDTVEPTPGLGRR